MRKLFLLVIILGIAVSAKADLVHHWPLDGNLSEVISGNNGTATGTVSYAMGADGKSNSAIYVASASDYVSSQAAITVDGGESRTLSFWFKSAKQMQAAVSYGNRSSSGTLFEVLLGYPGDGYCGHFWTAGYDTADSGTGGQPFVTWNTWTMVTVTYDGTDVKLYQNGVFKRTATMSLGTGSSTYMYIGGGNGSGGQWDYDQFAGYIDDVRFYDAALDAGAIQQLYLDMTGAGLVYHWPLNGNLNEVIAGNNGVPTGSISYVEGADSVAGSAMEFSPTQYATSINDLGITGSTARTVNCWFKVPNDGLSKSPFGCGDNTAGNGTIFEFWLGNTVSHGDKFFAHFNGGGFDTLTETPVTYPTDTWAMATIVYDGTDVFVYQNAAFIAQKTLALGTLDGPGYIGRGLGVVQWGGTNGTGAVDDIRIYDYALAESEIVDLYFTMLSAAPKATGPNPGDASESVSVNTALSWIPGEAISSQKVLFDSGTGAPTTEIATLSGTDPDLTNVEIGGALAPNTGYSWQVVSYVGTTPFPGPVWSFRTGFGLMYHWPLNGDLTELISGNHGMPTGLISYVTGADGVAGSAMAFSDTQFATSTSALGIAGNEPRTISCWFKVPDDGGDHLPFSYGDTSSDGTLFEFWVSGSDGNKFLGHFWGSGFDTLGVTSVTYPADTWVMATIVYDGTDVMVYQNAAVIAQLPLALTTVDTVAMIGNGGWLNAGGRNNGGQVDDVRVYDVVLDADEVQQLYADMLAMGITGHETLHFRADNVDGHGNPGDASTDTLVNIADPGTYEGTINNGTGVVYNAAQAGTPYEYGIELGATGPYTYISTDYMIDGGTGSVTDTTWEYWLKNSDGSSKRTLYVEGAGRHKLQIETGPAPGDGAEHISVNTTLNWIPATGIDSQTVLFNAGTGAPTTEIATGLSATDSDLSNAEIGEALAPDTVYSWQVVSYVGSTPSTGPVYSFTTIVTPLYHWPLDGNLSEVISGNNGTATGAVSYATGADGKSNSAIYVTPFSYVSSQLPIVVDGSEPRTLSFWFKAGAQQQATVSYGSRVTFYELFEVLLNHPTGGYAGHFWSGNDTVTVGTGDQPIVSWNTWTMVTMTYDGTDVKLYQNGALKRTATLALNTLSTPMCIGGGNGSGGQWDYDQFAGYIDDVRLYDVALDAGAVSQLYGDMAASSANSNIYYQESPGGSGVNSVNFLNDNEFTQLVVTKSGDTMALYRNGQQTGAMNYSDSYTGTAPSETYFGSSAEFLSGQFNLIRMYDTAMSAADVAQLYTVTPDENKIACNPVPSHGAAFRAWPWPVLSELSWTNPKTGDHIQCDVYLGTEPDRATMDKVILGNDVSSVAVNTTNFPNYGNLGYNSQTYYWVVDCKDTGTSVTTSGFIWSFTTELTQIEATVVTELGGWVFTSHNQTIVQNDNGIFMTYCVNGRDSWYMAQSTDGGKSFNTIYNGPESGISPPCLETDNNYVYMMNPKTDGSGGVTFRRFAPSDYTTPDITAHPYTASNLGGGKYAMAYDPSRVQFYYAGQWGTLVTCDMVGNHVRTQEVWGTSDGTGGQYPHLFVDTDGTLHFAMTTTPGDLAPWYESIRYVKSTDGGANWKKMDGTLLSIPTGCGPSGLSTLISLPDEFDVNTWLSNMHVKNGKVHVFYLAETNPDWRCHYMRFDGSTGVREIDSWTDWNDEWRGTNVAPNNYYGAFASDPDDDDTLYFTGTDVESSELHLGTLVSFDNGSTWSDYARLPIHDPYYSHTGGCRQVSSDNMVIGSYTDNETGATLYQFPAFKQSFGSLVVTIIPQGAIDDGAQWRVDGGPWRNSGYTETYMTVGQHTVEYKLTNHWNQPVSHTVQIDADQTKYIAKKYDTRADIDLNDRVNLIDFSIMASRWQDGPCSTPGWCEQADINKSGAVDIDDLFVMADRQKN